MEDRGDVDEKERLLRIKGSSGGQKAVGEGQWGNRREEMTLKKRAEETGRQLGKKARQWSTEETVEARRKC